MKNLPNKIYLNFNMTPQEVRETEDQDFHKATKTWEITWSEERQSEYDPEYIRKDAFIEKVVKYLTDNFKFDDVGYCQTEVYSENSMIEDFKKYIKE